MAELLYSQLVMWQECLLRRCCGQSPGHGQSAALACSILCGIPTGRPLCSSAGVGFVGVLWWGWTSPGLSRPSGVLREEDLRRGGDLRELECGDDQRLQPERGWACSVLWLQFLQLVLTRS